MEAEGEKENVDEGMELIQLRVQPYHDWCVSHSDSINKIPRMCSVI